MKIRHEEEIPNGVIIVKERRGKESKGVFGGLVDTKTTRLLDLQARLKMEAVRAYYVRKRKEREEKENDNSEKRRS